MKDLKEYLIQETVVMTRQGIPSNADYVVYAINVGIIKKDGKTKFGWNLFDNAHKDNPGYLYSDLHNGILYSANDSFKVGDNIVVLDNDTRRKLPGAPKMINVAAECDMKTFNDAFEKEYYKINGYMRASDRKMLKNPLCSKQMYVIKGIEKADKYKRLAPRR